MGLDDIWYTSKQMYSINYRPLKPGSNLVVETIRFNPSVCTCGKQCSEPHYRMESRIINIADKVDIKDANVLADENYTSKVNTDDKSVNEIRAKVDIDEAISPSKGSVIKSSNGAHSTDNEIESKSAISVSLTSVGVSGDGDRETSIESGRSIKNDVEDRDVEISNMKCVDEVIGIADNIKCDVEVVDFRNDVKSETECEFVNANNTDSIDVIIGHDESVKNGSEGGHCNVSDKEFSDGVTGNNSSVKNGSEGGHHNVSDKEFSDGVTGNNSSVKNGSEDGHHNVSNKEFSDSVTGNNSSVKNGSEGGHHNVSDKELSDGVTGNNSSVKNGSEGGHCNVSNKEFSDGVTGNNSSVKKGFEDGHFNVSDVEDDVTKDDSSVKNGAEVRESNVRKVEYQDGVPEDISGINQESGKYKDVSVSNKDDGVDIASRSSMNQYDDHDIDEIDDVTVSDKISSDTSNADLRCIDIEIEETVPDNTTAFEEEISSAFGIMSVYCNSDLHSSRYICKDGDVLGRPYKRLDSDNDLTVAMS